MNLRKYKILMQCLYRLVVIDDYICVSENEIIAGMRLIAESERFMIEGSAAVAVAAFMQVKERYRGKKVATLLCGRNISLKQFQSIFG